jgi:Holliday junction resolvasome RuvABC endonuclease subunit
MIVLGIDPGGSMCGWARIDARGGDGCPWSFSYVSAGHVASDVFAVGELVGEGVDLVAVEAVEGYAFGGGASRGTRSGAAVVSALLATSGVAKAIAWQCIARGIRCAEISARRARSLVLRAPSATDKQIAHVVPLLVRGWPTRSNPHMRDAAVVAIAGAWSTMGVRHADA